MMCQVSGQEKDQAKQIFTSSAASGILTNDLVKILQDEKVCAATDTFLQLISLYRLFKRHLAVYVSVC